MNLYQIKFGEVYIRAAYKSFNEIVFTPDKKKCKHLREDEKDFVLQYFPHAEVKTFKVSEVDVNNFGVITIPNEKSVTI